MSEKNEASGDGQEFKVTDRRAFGPSGDRREADERDAGAADDETAAAPLDAASAAHDDSAETVRYPVNFRTLLARFSIEALVHLGLEANPETGQREVDLDAARVPIDLLSLLEEKTRGNLTDEEAHELQDVLYQLRMLYVEKTSAAKT